MPKVEPPVVQIREILANDNGFIKAWVSKDEGPVYLIPKSRES